MNERRVIQVAVGLTAALVTFIVGFSLGRNPQQDGLVLISSVPAAVSSSVPVDDTSGSAAAQPDETSDTAESGNEDPTFPVNLNTATLEQLDTVPGIGEVIAERILAYRESVGQFQTVEELLNVKGIGEKTLQEMREYLTVEESVHD